MSIAVSAAPEAKPLATAPTVVCHAHKFGGSSLANIERFRNVAALLRDESTARVVVVSAMQGVTDALTALAGAALERQEWEAAFRGLRERHLSTARELDRDGAHGLRA